MQRAMLLLLLLVVGGASSWVCAAPQQAFLEQQLPLRVLVTTPSQLALGVAAGQAGGASGGGDAGAVTLSGRQALTVRWQRMR
jgi:hypothetical protein